VTRRISARNGGARAERDFPECGGYSIDIDTSANKKFVASFKKKSFPECDPESSSRPIHMALF